MNVQTLIIIGIAVMLVLALSIILFVMLHQRSTIRHQLELKAINEQKELELIKASLQSEEEERNRIAAELHDDVVSTLASARLFLYKTKDASYDEEVINSSKTLLDQSIATIRNISHKLQPATLQYLGLERSLQSMVETLDLSGTVKATYTSNGTLPRVADSSELATYRISQELINNILKHSGAAKIRVHASASGEGIKIVFMHDGIGMSHDMYEHQVFKNGATGLKNIVNRLKSINATIQFNKINESEFAIVLMVPLSETPRDTTTA